MSKKIEIKCDNCGANLLEPQSYDAWMLRLTTQKMPICNGSVLAVLTYPPINGDAYFCNLKCLEAWLTRDAEIPSERSDGSRETGE